MPDSFFVSNSNKRKRSSVRSDSRPKKQLNGKGRPTGSKSKAKTNAKISKNVDEDLDSDETQENEFGGIDDMELRASDSDPGASGEEDDMETPAEKRLRLAKLYVESVKEGFATAEGEFDAAEIDKELIASRLKQDVLAHSGKLHKFIAKSLEIHDPPMFLRTRGHRQPVTAAVASSSGKYLFTSGKEGSIVRWDVPTGKQVSVFHKLRPESSSKVKGKAREGPQGHTDEVLALAVSDDGKYLASGGKDRRLVLWDVEKGEFIRDFTGHKDTISGLAFRKGTHQIYTASLDRSLKVFDLSPSVMGYVDTLFGHQDHVVDIDALRSETIVSVGARDRTVRFWKVTEEAQLVFRGGGKSKMRDVLEGGLEDPEFEENEEKQSKGKGKEAVKRFEEGSIDCVAMVDEKTFVSGGDSGVISVWDIGKKKPVFTQPFAHGLHEVHSTTEGIVTSPRWITALACVRYGDVIASGSWSSEIRLWKLSIDPTKKSRAYSLMHIGSLPAPGVVNSLQILIVPRSTVENYSWSTVPDHDATVRPSANGVNHAITSNTAAEFLMVVAGLGREPRLGRWMTMKGDGAGNGSRVFVLPVAKSSQGNENGDESDP